jgi:hypothetical protein
MLPLDVRPSSDVPTPITNLNGPFRSIPIANSATTTVIALNHNPITNNMTATTIPAT